MVKPLYQYPLSNNNLTRKTLVSPIVLHCIAWLQDFA